MQILNESQKQLKVSFREKLKKKILFWFHLTNDPAIKLYYGYGNENKIIVFGHTLKLSPLARKNYRKNIFNNTYGLLRLFMVKVLANAKLQLQWEDITCDTKSGKDGFFRFEIITEKPVAPGWHPVKVRFTDATNSFETFGEFFVPYKYQFAFISDIDDTFLVSHSSNLRKRLYVLFTKNARSRKPFEGVVNHYQLLANTGASRDTHNLFFYVSSSE